MERREDQTKIRPVRHHGDLLPRLADGPLYAGTLAASINLAETSSLSSIDVGAGLVPSLALAVNISLNHVLIAPSSSKVPGIVVCSENGRVMNLESGMRVRCG